ncbi:MAG: hypothetical protein HQ518_15230 [Rhodopirellula sp.]|jgi:hypothetical protein|nr:hypothetical protein [Rhodopirellula sp.]
MTTTINAISDDRLQLMPNNAVSRGIVSAASYTQATNADRLRMDRWDELFDSIATWKLENGRIDEDGVEWPTQTSCEKSQKLFIHLEEHSPELVRFGRLVIDGDGGIAFEARSQQQLLRYEISDTGNVTKLFIAGDRVLSHEVLDVV